MNNNNVIRVAKGRENPYSMVANRPVLDTRLSFKARGILWLCLSRPDNWQFNAAYLEEMSESDGRDAVRAGIRELEEAHYMFRIQVRDPHTTGFPLAENPPLLNTDSIPNTDLPKTEESGAQSAQPPDFLPDQFSLSVKDIKARHFTRAEWSAILEAEKARGDAARKSLVAFAENKLSVNQHPAIQAYREETHYYPPAEWGNRIIETVGANGRLDLWREVVAAYVGSGWNPRNVKAMLEYFQRGEIPRTAPASSAARAAPPPQTPEEAAQSARMFARAQRLLQEKPEWMPS